MNCLQLFLFSATFLCIYSCINNNVQEDIKRDSEEFTKLDSSSLMIFIEKIKKAEAADEIPALYSEKFIRPALSKFVSHPYLSDAVYSYDEIAYEDSLLVVVSFYYKAKNGFHLLGASFLASFSKTTEQFIDSEMVFGSSVFNYQDSLGYDIGYSFRSDRRFDNNSTLVFTQECVEKYFYQNFRQGIPKKQDSKTVLKIELNKKGCFHRIIMD